MQAFCEIELKNEVMFTMPDSPWSAIGRGGVLGGLMPSMIGNRKNRNHIAYAVTRDYDDKVDKPEDRVLNPGGRPQAKGYLQHIIVKVSQLVLCPRNWPLLIPQGETIIPGKHKTIQSNLFVQKGEPIVKFNVDLYSYEGEAAPDNVKRIDQPGVPNIILKDKIC